MVARFRDYVSARGVNDIRDWLSQLPTKDRVAIQQRITYIEATSTFSRPYFADLKGECQGLHEVRVSGNRVAYRPICYRGPGSEDVTLLIGAVEKGGKLEPRKACDTAFGRIDAIRQGTAWTCEHEFF